MRKLELLIPAGSLDVLKTAVLYGADAVYLGGEAFGLRAKAKNFTITTMKIMITPMNITTIMTMNIIMHMYTEIFMMYLLSLTNWRMNMSKNWPRRCL